MSVLEVDLRRHDDSIDTRADSVIVRRLLGTGNGHYRSGRAAPDSLGEGGNHPTKNRQVTARVLCKAKMEAI